MKIQKGIVNHLLRIQIRPFASKFPKGAAGKEHSMGQNSGFPNHKELFNRGYYNGEDGGIEDETEFIESPFSKRMRDQENAMYGNDAVEYENENLSKLKIDGGILSNYKKVTGQTMEDMLEGDYWRANKDVQHQAAKFFNHVTENEQDMMNNTKNYTIRHRLNRELDFSDDFRKKYITKDYGNYQKYENNSVSTEYDAGLQERTQDKIYENYMNLIRNMPTKEAEGMDERRRTDIRDQLTKQTETHKTFAERFMDSEVATKANAQQLDQIEEEIDFLDDPTNYERAYYGRMSPFVKETIFREYQKGYTVKDLSLKYGILQTRVKAIIFQKHLYWNEVYPRLGETHMRLALEKEAIYASKFPFVEYGLDLNLMSELEKGLKMEYISRTEYDTDPAKQDKETVESYEQMFTSQSSRVRDLVPLEFSGKAGHGYVLYERVAHKGKDSPRVSQNFKDVARHYGAPGEKQMLKKVHLKRMKAGGIRYASLADRGSS